MNLFLIWKYKNWIAIAILCFISLGQLAYTNHLAGQLIRAEAKKNKAVADAVEPYKTAIAKATTEKIRLEKQYLDNLVKAEQHAIKKIKAANDDAHSADVAANSLSRQLSEAKRRVSSASTETIVKYTNTSSNVLEQCVAEYRLMAKAADAERIDKERLNVAWPE